MTQERDAPADWHADTIDGLFPNADPGRGQRSAAHQRDVMPTRSEQDLLAEIGLDRDA